MLFLTTLYVYLFLFNVAWNAPTGAPTTHEGLVEFYTGTAIGNGTIVRDGHKYYYDITQNGDWIAEGDIIVGTNYPLDQDPTAIIRRLLPLIDDKKYRWPDCVVPYQFDGHWRCDTPSAAVQQVIKNAIAHWEAKVPGLKFQLRTGNEAKYPDYVYFCETDDEHSSAVGKQGGGQKISIAGTDWRIQAGQIGVPVHEIGHALGFYHTHSREDRDDYVDIDIDNVKRSAVWGLFWSARHNFDKHEDDATDCGVYDFDSIMHYGPKAFADDSTKNTITKANPLPADYKGNPANMGQRIGLSAGDIACARALWPNMTNTTDPTTDPTHSPTTDPTTDPTGSPTCDPSQVPNDPDIGKGCKTDSDCSACLQCCPVKLICEPKGSRPGKSRRLQHDINDNDFIEPAIDEQKRFYEYPIFGYVSFVGIIVFIGSWCCCKRNRNKNKYEKCDIITVNEE